MKTTILLLIVLSCSFSCDHFKQSANEEVTDPGVIKSYFKNGKLKAEFQIDADKKRHGLSKTFYESGKPRTEITYTHGNKERAIQYYENGNKYLDLHYKDGFKHGERIKYWDNGQVHSKLEYDYNHPKIGLEEYNRKGKKLKKYPKLMVKQIDRLSVTGEYIVEIYFDKNSGRGTYYVGKLTNGFLNDQLDELPKKKGKARIVYTPPPHSFQMIKLHLVGKFKTVYGNPYIVEKSVNVAIDF